MDQNEHKLIPIPLPTEIPEPPSLDKLPLDVVHSATVEMLIQQNEDLSARLKVNIRRNSVQEQEMLKLQKEVADLKRRNDNLRAQNEIVQEKQSLWQAQKEEKNRQYATMLEEQKLMELRYNELYTTSQYRTKELQDKVLEKSQRLSKEETSHKEAMEKVCEIHRDQKDLLQRKLRISQAIREKGKDRFREFLIATAEASRAQLELARKLQGENGLLRRGVKDSQSEFTKREQFLKDKIFELSELSKSHIRNLEKRLKDCEKEIRLRDERMANIESIHQDNMAQELELEREKQRELEIRIEELKSQIANEGHSRAQVQKLSDEIVSIRNEKIEAQREQESEKEELSIENIRLKDLNQRLRNDNSSLSVQLHEHKKILESCEKKLIDISRDNEQLEKELGNLKTLWVDIQDKYEKELVKVQSLTKLNRQLSENIFDKKAAKNIEAAAAIEKTPASTETKSDTSNTERIDRKISEIFASQFQPMD